MAVPSSAGFYTTVRNTSGATRFFGFLPPHGRKLTNNSEVTFSGDITKYLTCPRDVKAFKTAIENGSIVVTTGETASQIVYCAVLDASVIAAGDLVYLDTGTGTVKAAADFTWNTDLATTQGQFAPLFLGVAQKAHASGAITNFPVDVSPSAIYSFTCTSETHEIGDTLGPKKAAGNALVSNALVKSTSTNSIAICAKRDALAATSVSVQLMSVFNGRRSGGAAGPQGSTGTQGFQGRQGFQGT